MPDIYAVWNEAGYVEPSVEEQFGKGQPNRTIVTLPLVLRDAVSHNLEKGANKGANKGAKRKELDERKKSIYEEIRLNPNVKNVELESIIGATKRQIELSLKSLQDDGRIMREGRKGKWIIIDNVDDNQ